MTNDRPISEEAISMTVPLTSSDGHTNGQADQQNDNSPTNSTSRAFGRVATPASMEATADTFGFWVPEGTAVERTQIVRATSTFPGFGPVNYYAIVEDVARRSRRRDILEERDRYDGSPDLELTLDSGGVTYARTRVLTSTPALYTPPREESPVVLASDDDARVAYGVPEMDEPLAMGLLKNGATRDAGLAYIDLAYLFGQNGAHLNVTGISGAATKSSALTTILSCVLAHVERRPDRQVNPLHVVPIILNTKGTDLLFLDRPSRHFARRRETEDRVWAALGIDPRPFQDPTFFVPRQFMGTQAMPVGRVAQPYSWGLRDLIEQDLFLYLFGDEDREDDNFAGLVTAILNLLVSEHIEGNRLVSRMRDDAPAHTLGELVSWVAHQIDTDAKNRALPNQAPGTWSKLYRRLLRIVQSGSGVIRRDEERGSPLRLTATTTLPPRVVDVQSIAETGLQRFVVAAILKQLAEARTGPDAIPGLRYILVLDELNRWAPRGNRDPITRLFERVATEMRSQGIVLFGAQQQASQVSEKVVENASIKLLGRTGALELDQTIWRGLPYAFKTMVANLGPAEKIVLTPTARQPMIVRMPFPPWAMRREDAEIVVGRRSVQDIAVEEE